MGVSNTVQQLSVLENREGRLEEVLDVLAKKRCEYCCTESCGYIRLWNASSDRF